MHSSHPAPGPRPRRHAFPPLPAAARTPTLSAVLTAAGAAAVLFAAACAADDPPAPVWRWAESHFFSQGRYSDALRMVENLQRHLTATGQAASPEFVQLALQRGVILARGLGDHERATGALQEADALCVRLQGDDSPARLEILNRQCELLVRLKRPAEAAEIGRSAVRLARKLRGNDHADTAKALHYLALALAELPDSGGTEPILREVLSIHQKKEGLQAYWTGIAWNNLGIFHLEHGRREAAHQNILTGATILFQHVSEQTPDAVAMQRNLIRLALEGEKRSEALRRAERLFAVELGLFRQSFPSLDEGGRLDMKAQFQPGRWFSTLGEPQAIARALLQTKAMTLDEMLVVPAGDLPNTPDPFADLLQPANAARGFRPYAPAAHRAPATPMRSPPAPTRPPHNSDSRYTTTPAQVCAGLPPGSVAIEFTRYPHYVGRFKDELRYGALIFLPHRATNGDLAEALRWVPLGPAEIIDREINALLDDATDSLAALKFATRLKALYQLVWSPIAQVLPPGTEQVFLSPDGQLCFLPFSGLLDPHGNFLADRHLVMYVSTVRDLFRTDATERVRTDRLSIFAAPHFGPPAGGAGDGSAHRYRDADARAFGHLQLPDLPGARREALLLENLAAERNLATQVFIGNAASKANVQQLREPGIVHFATHGFLLASALPHASSNPMDRSGLALAGAEASLTALAAGRSLPSRDHDGLLTARQVAQLPWHGTWLVALSACHTGRGEARDGESVLGLRRGFLAAGVQNLLLSLWRISDDHTVDLMREFYVRALDSADPAAALALTQRAWLQRLRRESGIAAAVTTAGAFVLNTSGRWPLPPAR